MAGASAVVVAVAVDSPDFPGAVAASEVAEPAGDGNELNPTPPSTNEHEPKRISREN